MKTKILPFLALFILFPAISTLASTASEPLPKQDWSFSGPLGTFDRAALQRGYKVYREVCSACHAMKQMSFRNLSDLGYNEDQIKAIAAEYTVTDGPDDEGEMFERAARPSDKFPSPYKNDKAAAAANGALPPDLSLIVKARKHGPDYIYGLLTGFEEAPGGHHLAAGQHWNKYMPGNIIAMAPPLSDGMISYEDKSPETMQQYAADVSEFLTWASEPYLEKRRHLGVSVLIFLSVFAFLMYRVKKKIWSDLH